MGTEGTPLFLIFNLLGENNTIILVAFVFVFVYIC
jgi:hypothetical protein